MFGRRVIYVIIGLTIAFSLIIGSTAQERTETTQVESWLMDIFMPFQTVVYQIGDQGRDLFYSVGEIGNVYNENKRLQEEVETLEQLRVDVELLRQENARLRELLQLDTEESEFVSAAKVIGRNPDNWFSEVIINRGRVHGIEKDMVVVNSKGLVGRVSKVSDYSSTVVLVTDPDSGVGAKIARSGHSGVVSGQVEQTDLLLMKFFSRDADVVVGDTVLTSGYGSMYPEGKLIGTVVGRKTDSVGLVTYAVVKPSVDFDRLDEVLVLKLAYREEEVEDEVELEE